MNKERRTRIHEICEQLESLSADIEGIRQEEEDHYDNMPEFMQEGEKGEKTMDAISQLENAQDGINDVVNLLTEAANS